MPDEAIIKTINLIIAPVVMITACAIIVNGLIVRYASLAERIRGMYGEQLHLLELGENQSFLQQGRLQELERLLPEGLDHHHQIHNVLGLVYLAILVFLLDMLLIASAVSFALSWLAPAIVVVFLIGTAVLFWSMMLTTLEIHSSHGLIQQELHQNCRLCQKK